MVATSPSREAGPTAESPQPQATARVLPAPSICLGQSSWASGSIRGGPSLLSLQEIHGGGYSFLHRQLLPSTHAAHMSHTEKGGLLLCQVGSPQSPKVVSRQLGSPDHCALPRSNPLCSGIPWN